MTSFDFDKKINRLNTDSIRWDQHASRDIIPLWVADMDFACPPCVSDALQERISHGVFGYTHAPYELNERITQYLSDHYAWKVDPSWIVILPSVVSSLYTSVQQLTRIDEHVLVPKPVYHHLRLACSEAGRDFTEIPLIIKDDRWVMPFDTLEQYVKPKTKLALLCNPQNPGGTVFTQNELEQFANTCISNNLWLCSDEIHAGLVLEDGVKHIPIASLNPEISKRTITLMSLNKTFNFPGIGLAWAVTENPELRKKMQAGLHAIVPEPSLLAYTSTMAALNEGEPWRKELVTYLQDNLRFLNERIKKIPGLSIGKTQASYLAWIDCSQLPIKNPRDLFLEHGVALSPGSQFNEPSFVRLNFGTQRARLAEALTRMEYAVSSLIK